MHQSVQLLQSEKMEPLRREWLLAFYKSNRNLRVLGTDQPFGLIQVTDGLFGC